MTNRPLAAYEQKPLPAAPPLERMIGPSLVLLGLGLGSGEIILWPYLSANFGLGIIWAAFVGLTLQFFLNMEIERYTLIRGESVFVGFARLNQKLPYWFILSTFIGFGWPGIVAASAKILSQVVPVPYTQLAIGLLLMMGLILSLGSSLYKTIERYQKVMVTLGIPLLLLITVLIVRQTTLVQFANGLIGHGQGYWFIPPGIPLFTFLGALAYAGAGGNLNFAQSFYVKEKDYGMGLYSSHLKSILAGHSQEMKLTGTSFPVTKQNTARFQIWWQRVSIEHGLIFWGLGALTISLLAMLAYATAYGQPNLTSGLDFLFTEQAAITLQLGVFFGVLFLLVTGLMMFGTQLTILDCTSRIITENLALLTDHDRKPVNLRAIYYWVLWTQIIFGCLVFLSGFSEPRTLVVIGAVANAFAMFVGFGLTLRLNTRLLPAPLQPNLLRRLILILACLFFAYFAGFAVLNALGVTG